MPLIQLENLSKTYESEAVTTQALSNISFSIQKGEFLAIMGPSGSGKSTLLHILGLLDSKTTGNYLFESTEVDKYSEKDKAKIRNKKIGFIFQAFNLLARTTVLDNVKLPLLYSQKRESDWDGQAEKAIEAVGLTHRISHISSQLSGGEKQRVAIARALINDPELILADEPTGNLDSKSGSTIMQIMQQLNKEQRHTIIVITHEPNTASFANRIIQIKDGTIESDRPVS